MKNRLILILLVAFTLTACTKDMYNVGILNQVFSSDECSYNMNNTRYTCIGETSGDTRMDGYVSVHYDENCHIFGKTTDHDAQIYCY